MHVIKNFLKEEEFRKIKDIMLSPEFPWYYLDSVVNPGDGYYQFIHHFYKDCAPTKSCHILNSLVNLIEPVSIVRIKANLTTNSPKLVEHGYHTDYNNFTSPNLKTAIFYINNNDGYTKFKTGETIQSEENKIIIFDADKIHTRTNCTDKKCRIVINLNFFK